MANSQQPQIATTDLRRPHRATGVFYPPAAPNANHRRPPTMTTRRRLPLSVLLVAAATPILCSATTKPTTQPTAAPAQMPLEIRVDPRVELMSIIFHFAGHPEYDQCQIPSYKTDAHQHFAPFQEHEVFLFARELRNRCGVSFDAVMSLAVHLTDAETLSEKLPFDPPPPTLDKRWTTHDARKFRELARDFAQQSNFAAFLEQQSALYAKAQRQMQTLLETEARLDWFPGYFGPRPNTTFVVIPTFFSGNYGTRIQNADGTTEFHSIIITNATLLGKPTFANCMGTIVHEFCHSYCNPIVDRHLTQLQAAGERIFPPLSQIMQRQAYGSWQTMMYESAVRVCTVRYFAATAGPQAAQRAVRSEHKRGFIWTADLSALLQQFESQRDDYPTFESFFPTIVEYFNANTDQIVEQVTK